MRWSIGEIFPLETDGSCALWRAAFRLAGGEQTVEIDGMDLAVVEGELLKRNEVYFDRALLAALVTSPARGGHRRTTLSARQTFRRTAGPR